MYVYTIITVASNKFLLKIKFFLVYLKNSDISCNVLFSVSGRQK